MSSLIALITQYESWLYGLLGLLGLLCLIFYWSAAGRFERTPFGLEKDSARSRQNAALFVLICVLFCGGAVFTTGRYLAPQLGLAEGGTPPPTARPTAPPTPTLIQSTGPLNVDSSGCRNPNLHLTSPAPNEVLAGPYKIVGTANIPNFAFYKVDISGAATSGAWVALVVGSAPVIDDALGTFDTNPYVPGTYAFRLTATDNLGNAAPPCVIPVTFVTRSPTATPTEVIP